MTVAAAVRKVGPTPGNSLATVFPFAFKVFVASDLKVELTVIASGLVSTLVLNDPLGYTVALNPDQNANPGGSITYNPLGVPLPPAQALTISSIVPETQGTHIVNGGAFFANNIEDAVDKAVINVQDLASKVGAAVQFPSADSAALNAVLPPAAQRANQAVLFDNLGNVIVGSVPNAPVAAAWLPVVQAATLALGRAAMGFSAYFDSLIAAANAAAMRLLLGFSAIAAKGDLFVGTAANTIVTKTVGADGRTLIANSAQADGLEYAEGFPRRNLLINGCFRLNQALPATSADDTYAHDQWNVLTEANPVALSTLTDVENTTHFMARLTQSNAAAQRMGYAQIIEGKDCKHLRGKTVNFRFGRKRQSTGANVRIAILEWTGTEDAVTSDVVNNWASGVYTAGNFFLGANLTVSAVVQQALLANTLTDGSSVSVALGGAFNNLVVFIWTEAQVAQNVTLDLAKAQLEVGSVPTEFERRKFTDELLFAQRFYAKTFPMATAPAQNLGTPLGALSSDYAYGAAAGCVAAWRFPVRMRAIPTVTTYNTHQANVNWRRSDNAADAARSFNFSDESSVSIQADTSTTAGSFYTIQATADARL